MANETSASDQFLQFFWDLASFDPAVRQEAALKLTMHLITTQKAFEENASGDIRAKIQHHQEKTNEALHIELSDLETCFHHDVAYATKRLIRGLSSPRQGARQGFSLALSMMIEKVLNFLSIETIITWIDTLNPLSGGLKRFEQRDMLFGRVFGCIAIIQANIFDRKHSSMIESYKKLVEYVTKCSFEKNYLRELGAYSIALFFNKIDSSAVEIFPAIKEKIVGDDDITAESLVILFSLNASVKEDLEDALQCFKLSNFSDICDPKNYPIFENALLNSTVNSHPRIHTVWQDFLRAILDSSNASERIASFWRYFIDERLCHSTMERKYLALSLFSYLLPLLDERNVPLHVLFTEKFLAFLLDTLRDPKKLLYKVAARAFDTLLNYARKDRKIVFQFMSRVMLPSAQKHVHIDRLLQSGLDNNNPEKLQDEIRGYAEWLICKFFDDSQNEAENFAQKQQWCIKQLAGIVKNKKIQKTEPIVLTILVFLLACSFEQVNIANICQNFAIEKPPIGNFAIAQESRFAARFALLSVLSELQSIDLHMVKKRSSKNIGKTSNNMFWVEAVTSAIFESMTKMPENIRKNVLSTILSNDFPKPSIRLAFSTLLLQYWCSDSVEECQECEETLNDLAACSFQLGYIQENCGKLNESDLPPLQVLVDCMLSLLSRKLARPSSANFLAATGIISQQAVRLFVREFASEMNVDCITLIVSIFDPVLAFETSGEIIEEVETDSDQDSAIDEIDSSDSESSDSSDDEDHFHQQLNAVSEDISNENDDSENDFDDEQMLLSKFDDKVAHILKEKKRLKKEDNEKSHKKAEFVLLSLDVIENYLKQLESQSITTRQIEILEMIAISLCHTSMLYDKIHVFKAAETCNRDFFAFITEKVYSLSENVRLQITSKANALLKNCFAGIKVLASDDEHRFGKSFIMRITDLICEKTLLHGWQLPFPSRNLIQALASLLPWLFKSVQSCSATELEILFKETYVTKLYTQYLKKSKPQIPVSIFLETLRILGNMVVSKFPLFIWTVLAATILEKLSVTGEGCLTVHQQLLSWNLMSHLCKMTSGKVIIDGDELVRRQLLTLADNAAVHFNKSSLDLENNNLKRSKDFLATLISMRRKFGVDAPMSFPLFLKEMKLLADTHHLAKNILNRLKDSGETTFAKNAK